MRDSMGTLPKITSAKQALEDIIVIAKDKRTHPLLQDCNEWLELKMKVIRELAKRGLEVK